MRNRKNVVVVHMSDKELYQLNRNCQVAGLRREQFLRAAVNGIELKPRPPDSYKDLAREIAAVGNNINQLTHLANSTGYVTRAQMEQVSGYLREIWRLVQEKAG